MPRSLKVVVSCDYCMSSIEDEDHGGALVLMINNEGPRQVDLCSECLTHRSVVDLLGVFDQADDLPAPSRREGGLRCPACRHTASTPQGLGRHTKSVHHMTLRQLRGEAP